VGDDDGGDAHVSSSSQARTRRRARLPASRRTGLRGRVGSNTWSCRALL
jgi:hypothetical protein